jgi:hypothetical protein
VAGTSYDFLDNLGHHSAERILRELQHIKAGDLIPMGPGEDAGMWVKEFVPNRSILWWDKKKRLTTWAWALDPMPDGTTSLVTRVRSRSSWRTSMTVFWLLMVEVADFPMMRNLPGIKRRAEVRALAFAGMGASLLVARPSGHYCDAAKPRSGVMMECRRHRLDDGTVPP